ncbi:MULTISPECIES: 1-deoxy-D-xylulose-5-phosphate synthase [unclassified Campylobacter]|uniref:1-deoxy-D-xylulose-5-phosphate synthase n=1 Tax=unclassified Campylobacter TaxID=2593542 RepID=UPI0022EA036E|nr:MULTISPECIES: 1-deoxy-D-xylulose-5-phosphate synthase [unclassified Campylobacter]MDA3062103.1 1-deoxy-D-xylulose-5-phosphate synthase [Campylobacter sp. JMF_14 EL1]MDA3072793.1 1-deoxy-D-xylulose-5-phosphate synthase [Campylobacter sp. JMF_10 EL2]
MDIKNKSLTELSELCEQIRTRIVEVVSQNGGHLSSNMGAVEAIVAMHVVFDSAQDPFIFDVSHQSYAHKLLTGRWDEFSSLRKFGGLSGYTKPSESKHDYFVAGHASTSISLAVGAAKAIKLKGEDRVPVVLVGDGSMSGGMTYEAMNELGDLHLPCVIILNDNKMSISKPIGAFSKYLSQMMAGETYQKFKSRIRELLSHAPESATYMARRFENSLKLIIPGMFFEELGLEYIGPVDGHNLGDLISAFKVAKSAKKPVIVHIQTIKGKGYKNSENDDGNWHGVGAFDIKSGEFKKKSGAKSATKIYQEALLELAQAHSDVVGVTAAMPSGTGLDALIERFPDRFWDVAIAEEHAVTSMAAMAKEGFRPYITIYSTFMQRAVDQVIHDLALMNLNAVIAMDRAGIVGEDGETHEGVFDISLFNGVPNLSMCAPCDEASFRALMRYSHEHKGILAIRYPRGSFTMQSLEPNLGQIPEISPLKSRFIKECEASQIAFIGYGDSTGKACEVAKILNDKISVNIVDLVFVKPLDREFLLNLAKKTKIWFVFSQSMKKGGVGEILGAFLQEENIQNVKIISYEFDDKFLPHGSTADVEKSLGLDAQNLAKVISNTKNYQLV